VWPVEVECRDTTAKGSARSGQPQYGQVAVVAPSVVLVMSDSFAGRDGWNVATQPGWIGATVYVQVDFVDLILKRGLHD